MTRCPGAWACSSPTTDSLPTFPPSFLPSFPPALRHCQTSSLTLFCILSSTSPVLSKYSTPALQAHLEEIMSVNGGGGFASHWHNGTNGTNGTNSHMGLKTDISEEEYKNYEHGVQVIDENKELTYVQFLPLVPSPLFRGISLQLPISHPRKAYSD